MPKSKLGAGFEARRLHVPGPRRGSRRAVPHPAALRPGGDRRRSDR